MGSYGGPNTIYSNPYKYGKTQAERNAYAKNVERTRRGIPRTSQSIQYDEDGQPHVVHEGNPALREAQEAERMMNALKAKEAGSMPVGNTNADLLAQFKGSDLNAFLESIIRGAK